MVHEATPEEHHLAHLAVSSTEEDAYHYLLLHPDLGEEALALALDLSIESCRALLECLAARGMIRMSVSGELSAIDPPVVIERLIESRLQSLQEQMQKVHTSRHLVEMLLSRQRQSRQRASAENLEYLDGLDEVRTRIDELTFFTHHELLSVHPTAAWSAAAIEATRNPDLRCLRRGIRMRTIVCAEVFEDPATFTYLAELISRGAEVRTTQGALERVLIFDQHIAMVPHDPASSSQGALLIRQPGLVSILMDYFERVWAGATDGTLVLADTAEDTLSEIEKKVVQVMALVDKDEIGARELGVSVRTYRAYVARVMKRLNASNRFQAALRARERGWI